MTSTIITPSTSGLVDFDEGKHEYSINGKIYTSVTQVLKDTKIADFDYIPRESAEYSMDVGSKVHKATQLHDEGDLDLETLDSVLVPDVTAYKEYIEGVKCEPELIEYRFVNLLYGFAGTLDRTMLYPPCTRYPFPTKAVLDIKKTKGVIKGWVGIQMAAYVMSLKSPLTYRRIALRLTGDGKAQHREFPQSTLMRDWNGFLAALTVFNLKRSLT